MSAHVMYGSGVKSFAESDADLYPVAAQVGTLVNGRASRTDITAVVAATAGHGAPACFIPALAEIHLNTETIDIGAHDKVDFTDALWGLTHAPAVGALCHEASHAEHSLFDPAELMTEYGATRKMVDVITTLEEPRVEGLARSKRPSDRTFLRGCAMDIVARDFTISDSRYGASVAAGLLLARVDAGILTKAEVKDFRDKIEGVLGTDVLAALEPLWVRFLALDDDDYPGMVDVAREWLEALGEDPEDTEDMAGASMIVVMMPGDPGDGEPGGGKGEGEGEGSGESDDGESKGGEGEGEGEGSGFGEAIMGKVREVDTKIDGETTEKRGDERDKRKRDEKEADAARGKEAERPHREAFHAGGLDGYSPDGFAHMTSKRPPTADERRAAKSLASTLERIDFRDKAVAKVTSAVPPGRLRGSAAVQDAALRSMGRDSEAAPWAAKKRVKVDSTPLTIGFAVDISGSMSSAMQPLASTQWVVSTAGAHIDAKVASVHFGNRVHGVTPAGVRERDVRVFYPGDGTEAWKAAALALDKELNLLDGRGARLLIVASDGHFVNPRDAHYAETFMPLAKRKGVAVIFLNFTGHAKSYGAKSVDCRGKSPVEVAALVGKAAIKEMQRVDRRA